MYMHRVQPAGKQDMQLGIDMRTLHDSPIPNKEQLVPSQPASDISSLDIGIS